MEGTGHGWRLDGILSRLVNMSKEALLNMCMLGDVMSDGGKLHGTSAEVEKCREQ